MTLWASLWACLLLVTREIGDDAGGSSPRDMPSWSLELQRLSATSVSRVPVWGLGQEVELSAVVGFTFIKRLPGQAVSICGSWVLGILFWPEAIDRGHGFGSVAMAQRGLYVRKQITQ